MPRLLHLRTLGWRLGANVAHATPQQRAATRARLIMGEAWPAVETLYPTRGPTAGGTLRRREGEAYDVGRARPARALVGARRQPRRGLRGRAGGARRRGRVPTRRGGLRRGVGRACGARRRLRHRPRGA